MGYGISSLIGKSFRRNLKPGVLLFFVTVFSMAFMLSYVGYREMSTEKNIRQGYETYGSYRLYIYDVSHQTAREMEDDTQLNKTAVMYTGYTDDRTGRIIYASEDIFGLSNIELVSGRFPETEDEILCERDYLNRCGLSYEEGKQLKITLDGRTYSVTGLIRSNEYLSYVGIYMTDFIMNYDACEKITDMSGDFYSVLCMTDRSLTAERERIMHTYHLDENNISYNEDALAYAGINAEGKTTDIFLGTCDVMLYVIMIFMVILFVSIFTLMSRNNVKNAAIYNALGIRGRKMTGAVLMMLIMLFLSSGIVLSATGAVITSSVLGADSVMKFIVKAGKIVIPYIAGCITFSAAGFAKMLPRDTAGALSGAEDIDSRKRRKKPYKISVSEYRLPFLQMAKLNMSMRSGKYVMSLFGLVAAMVFTSLFMYVSHYIYRDSGEYRYDYRVDYSYSSFADQIDGTEANYVKYEEMKKNSVMFEIFPFFAQTYSLEVRKSDLSADFVKYLKNSDAQSAVELDHIDDRLYTAGFFVIGADEEMLRHTYELEGESCVSLEDDECIIVRNVKTPDGAGFETGIEKGDRLVIGFVGSDEKKELNVRENVTDINLPLEDSNYLPVIIVNMNLFSRISNYRYNYPQYLYFNSDEDYESVTEFFKGCSDMSVSDLSWEKAEIRKQKNMISTVVYSGSALLLAILVVNTLVSYIDKFRQNRKQIAVMKAMGVDDDRLLLFMSYEYIITTVTAVIAGTGLSLAGCYIAHFYIRTLISSFMFEILPYVFIIPAGSIVAVTVIMVFIFRKMNGRMDIAECLSKE